MRPWYRADHVGSLLRPQELLDARNNPNVTRDQLTTLEDKHILEALTRQQAAALKIFTDGEFRCAGFMSDFYDSVEGLDHGGEIARAWNRASSTIGGTSGSGAARTGLAGVAVEKVVQKKRLTQHEVDFLKTHAPGDIKVTLPTANQFPAICYKKGVSEKAYPSRSAFLWDIVPIIKAEIQALVAEGVKYIQIDAPRYSYYIDPKSERAGTFEPLRFVPRTKAVVLGLVSSKLPDVEHQDQLMRRIEEAGRYLPLQNLALSPQCGFASAMEGNLLSQDDQWRKLQLVVDTARKVWKDA